MTLEHYTNLTIDDVLPVARELLTIRREAKLSSLQSTIKKYSRENNLSVALIPYESIEL